MSKIVQLRPTKWLVGFALALVALAAYAPVVRNGFIDLDDSIYVLNNSHVQQGFSWSAIQWAFGSYSSDYWLPLAWLSHMLDFQLYGLNPAGHHCTSLIFHIANTLLLFLLFRNLTGRLWPGAFVALLFAIHPLHVESVAWVSERKDVLSAFFFLVTLLAYARYVEKSKVQGPKSKVFYGLTLLFFALGLMSKPMVVTLPCVLCLLDYWPLQRFQFPLKSQPGGKIRLLALEKVPFLILTVPACLITIIAQSHSQSLRSAAAYPLDARLENTPVIYVWYLVKLFWPTKLSIFYPLQIFQPMGMVMGALVLMTVLTLLAMRSARHQPYILVGWFWFVIMLLPVSGIIQVGNVAVANRFSYLPYIGLFIIIAWGFPELLAKWRHRTVVLAAGALLAGAICFQLTSAQVRLWKNTRTLFERAVALNPNNGFAWWVLGIEFRFQGNADHAIECLQRATTIAPGFVPAWKDLGSTLCLKKEFGDAQYAYQTALRWSPNDADTYRQLGDLFMTTGQPEEAIANFQRALELGPNQPETCVKLARAFVQNREPDEAIIQYENAIRLQPRDASPELELAMILADTGQHRAAITHYWRVLDLETNSVVALNNVAWLLATDPDASLRDGKEAARLAERACQLTQYQEAFLIGTLAAAYAEAGRFNDAVATAQKARMVALAKGQKEIAAANERWEELYKSGHAFHQEAGTSP
jgi:tetratricopeptide (TPR) repeat protein